MAFYKASSLPAGPSASRDFFDFMVPLVILLAFTAIFRITDLDLTLSGFFYSPEGGWKYSSAWICRLCYNYGGWPALAMTILAAIAILAGLVRGSLRRNLVAYRRPAIFIVVLMLLGPGLLVNVVLKDNTGRPRPREVAAFGGTSQFLKPLSTGERGNGESFPSGHASMGFFLAAPYFILRASRQSTARAWLIFGLASGLIIGTVRMAQGAHFASDVLWSWGIIHMSALTLSHVLSLEKRRFRQLPLP